MRKLLFLLISLFLVGVSSFAQEANSSKKEKESNFFNTEIDYQLRAYFSIGGSAPLGIPSEIREIESYNPGLKLGLEANATKWLSEDWGLRAGIAVESKGMKTRAITKNYLTEIIQADERLKGYYTGTVRTSVNNTYLSIPVSAVYKLSSRWNLYSGLFVSIAIDKEFDGYVSNGYLRQDTPVGPKINFEGEGRAAYDFSKEVQTFQWGMQLGAEWQLNRHFKLFPNVDYSFNGVLNKDFEAISFSLHNISLNMGFAYEF